MLLPAAQLYACVLTSTSLQPPPLHADDRLYLFMECMYGGELFDRIVDLGHFTEKMAQDVTFKL